MLLLFQQIWSYQTAWNCPVVSSFQVFGPCTTTKVVFQTNPLIVDLLESFELILLTSFSFLFQNNELVLWLHIKNSYKMYQKNIFQMILGHWDWEYTQGYVQIQP